MGVGYSCLAFATLYFFSDRFVLLFVDGAETEVIAQAQLFLRYNAAMYIPLAFVNILRFLIQGLGFTRQAMFAGVCEMIARSWVGFALVPAYGFAAACAANPAAWIAADLFLFPAYLYAMRRLRGEKTRLFIAPFHKRKAA